MIWILLLLVSVSPLVIAYFVNRHKQMVWLPDPSECRPGCGHDH